MDTFDNLTKYKIFLSAAENKSISKAAASLYISQPAVSITIKKLEENLNTTLFVRRSKGVELTEKGRLLYDSVKKAFQMLSDAEKSLKFPVYTGYLRIAASNVLCKHFLMPYLKEYIRLYPDTELAITCTSSAEARVMIEECCIDLALVVKPQSPGKLVQHCINLRVICACLLRHRFVVVSQQCHRIASFLRLALTQNSVTYYFGINAMLY